MTKVKDTVLFLEDDPVLGEATALQLELAGLKIYWCKTVREAVEAFRKHGPFSIALLDASLPDGRGLDVCEEIRSRDQHMPIIFLSAKADEGSVVEGLEKGGNDYLRKPIGKLELLARIRNLLHSKTISAEIIKFKDLRLPRTQRKLVYGKKDIPLNRREHEILACLMQNPDRVISRNRLLGEIDREGEIFDRTIDSHVSHIRSKLRKAGVHHIIIESIYGEGYKLGLK